MIAAIALFASTALAGSLGTAPGTSLDSVYAPRRVAVLVGVDSYTDTSLVPLQFAAKDARDLAMVLSDHRYGDFDSVTVVTGPQATTAKGIREAIDRATADLQRDDTFLLYLSGHGTLTIDAAQGSQLWFLPSDGKLEQARTTGLGVSWLEDRVADVEARRRVLIMDTCHNGRDKSSLDPATARTLASMRGEPPAPRGVREVSESEARLFAAQYYQPAMEDAELRNGVYTHFLINALSDGASQADLNRDGLVDVTEAHDWARDRTIAYTGGIQVPRAEYRVVGREDIYLAGNQATRTAAERALIAATDTLLANARVLVNGQPRGVLPEVIALDPGMQNIEIQDEEGHTLVRRTLWLRAGDTVMVEDLMPSRAASVDLTMGAAIRAGPGSAQLHTTVGELQAALIVPKLGTRWLVPEAHLNGTWGYGLLDVRGQYGTYLPVQAGELTLGLGAQLPLHRVPLSLGPSLESGAIWRSFTDQDGQSYRQAAPTVSPGLSAALRVPIRSGNALVVRYDARLIPYSYQGESTQVVHQGVRVGMNLHP